jgi:sialate O-acetylesterase
MGPVFDGFKVENGKMIIRFKNAKGLKTIDGQPPKGFWLTDKRHEKWYPAKAEIKGDTVVLSSDKVPEPAACRYAFAAKPEVNLVNAAGFPAYPFRTDDWTP